MVNRRAEVGEPVDEVLALLLEQQQAGVETLEDDLHATALLGEVADEQALLLEQALELREVALLLGEAVAQQVDLGVGFLLALRDAFPGALELSEVVDGEVELGLAQVGHERGVLARSAGLALERAELAVDLGRDVLGALEVGVHAREAAHRAFLAPLVLEHAGGLFDERAAVFGPRVQDLLEPALADDRVGVAAEAGVVKQLLHVHEARRGLVDQVLALAVAIHPAGDGDLGELEGQRSVAVVENEVDLGDAGWLTARRTGEDDVLHRLAAKRLGGLLAEDPQHGVGDVGLARPVGADDDGDARLHGDDAAVSERLEAFECERLEVHVLPGDGRSLRERETRCKRRRIVSQPTRPKSGRTASSCVVSASARVTS